MWFSSTTTWTRAWRSWKRPWSMPPPRRSGFLSHGCTDALHPISAVKTQCNMTFQMKRVRGVTGMWGFMSGYNHQLVFCTKSHLKKQYVCGWLVGKLSRELFIWLFRRLCFRLLRVRQIMIMIMITVPHVSVGTCKTRPQLWMKSCFWNSYFRICLFSSFNQFR